MAVLGLALALVGTIVEVVPAGASSVSRVTLRAPVVRSDGATAVLRGRVVGRTRTVRIEARTPSAAWRLLASARVRHGGYQALVRLGAGTQWVRVGVRGRYSPARKVVAKPTPPAPQPAPSDACGPRPVKADGSLWSCTFADDFDGATLDRSRWTVATRYATGTPDTYACAIDDPSLVSVDGGSLNLSLRRVDPPVPCDAVTPGGTTPYVAGTVSTVNHFSQAYGRFEARIRSSATTFPGLHEAFWLWPVGAAGASWPDSGEIDISETYSVYPHNSYPRLHSAADSDRAHDGVNTAWNCLAERGKWNSYTLEWSATRMEFFVNGKSCLVTTQVDQVFQKAYIPILTQALGGSYNQYDGRAPMPATMNVDYMRVWQ
jgi:beta-glucanase (GH16 family)